MANLITLGRMVLLFITIGFLYCMTVGGGGGARAHDLCLCQRRLRRLYRPPSRGRATAAGAVFDIAGVRMSKPPTGSSLPTSA